VIKRRQWLPQGPDHIPEALNAWYERVEARQQRQRTAIQAPRRADADQMSHQAAALHAPACSSASFKMFAWTQSGDRPQCLPPRSSGLMSDEHFTVDGTLIETWTSRKSFQRKDGGPDGGNFRGRARKNDTHASKTDPDARLYNKSNGPESRLAYLGHLLIENRHGVIADAMAKSADD